MIVTLFTLFYYAGILSRKETLPFSKEFFTVETSPTDRIWSFKKTSPINPKELDQLYQVKLDKGIRNIPLLSLLLTRESTQAMAKGEVDQAIEMARYSIKFSPDLPDPYFAMAKVLWHQNPFQIHKVLSELVKGEIAQIRYYPNSLKFFYNTFYILSNAILMALIIFGIILLIKYFPLYFYDIRRSLTQEISKLILNSLKIFCLFIPLFLRLDILWSLLYWSILLWGYVNKRERQLILIFFIFVVYLPFFLRTSSTFLDSLSSDILLDLNQANHEDWNKTTEERLRAWLTSSPDDPEVLFTLGLIEKRQGRYDRAEELYRRALQSDDKFSEGFSNLGNVFLAQRQTGLAISAYQQAIHLHPDKGAYYYNLYRAYSQETFLSSKIDQAFQRARQLDPKLVDHYMAIDSPNLNRLVVDEVLTSQRLWSRFFSQYIGKEGLLFRLFKAWFEKIPSRLPFLAPILFLGFLMGMSRYGRARRFLTRCPMCGSPTHRFYLGESEQEFVCFNCYRIFIQKEKLHPKIAEKKSIQVKTFQKENHLIGRFLSFIFVGFAYVWGNHPLRGLLLLFIFFVFILKFYYWEGAIPSLLSPSFLTWWKAMIWGVLFSLFYLLSIRKILRLKPKFEAEG